MALSFKMKKNPLQKGIPIDWLEVIMNECPTPLEGPEYQNFPILESEWANKELRQWEVGRGSWDSRHRVQFCKTQWSE